MMSYFFTRRSRLLQLRRGPLLKHLDGLAQELHQKGYQYLTGQQILSIAGRFNNFARTRGIKSAEQIDNALTECFLNEKLAVQGKLRHAPNALRQLMDYLRRNGVIAPHVLNSPKDPDEELLDRYAAYLSNIRGLAQVSCSDYRDVASRFLNWYRDQHPDHSISDLIGKDILLYVADVLGLQLSATRKQFICSLTRVFLRYLLWGKIIERDLARLVPPIPRWRLAKIPRHLSWDQVRALIDSVNTQTPEEKRDRAVLLLISTLGLRNKEVRSLQISHIKWRDAEIHFPCTKSLKERVLPLTREVGEALTDYILNGRPSVNNPHVFLSHRAPYGHYLTEGGIGVIIRKRLKNAGIKAPSNGGAHMLRHSLATRMVNVGVPIGEIADLLGHASVNTTAIYTKVDLAHLACVALPFVEVGAK